jgi:hypothetical protein
MSHVWRQPLPQKCDNPSTGRALPCGHAEAERTFPAAAAVKDV